MLTCKLHFEGLTSGGKYDEGVGNVLFACSFRFPRAMTDMIWQLPEDEPKPRRHLGSCSANYDFIFSFCFLSETSTIGLDGHRSLCVFPACWSVGSEYQKCYSENRSLLANSHESITSLMKGIRQTRLVKLCLPSAQTTECYIDAAV